MPRCTGSLSFLAAVAALALAACGGGSGGSSPTSPTSGAAAASCAASVTAAPPPFSPYGSTRSASVTVASGCAWTAVSDAPWVSVSSGASGSGNGTVTYAVAANSSSGPRSATLTIADTRVTIAQTGLIVPPNGADNYINFGEPGDETFHALSGWGQINPGLIPNGIDLDRSSRYQEITNTADVFVPQTLVPYILSVRTEDGACDDSFQVLVNNTLVFTYRHRDSSDIYPLHRIPVPAALVTGTTVRLAFVNTSTQACGHSAIYFARIDS